MTDQGAVVFGPAAPLDAPRRTVPVGGREWMVQLTEHIHASYVGSWTVLASGSVLVALLTLLAARTLRYESQLEQLTKAQERDVERTAKVARLARAAERGALGADNVEAVVRRDAGRPFDASEVALALDGPDDGGPPPHRRPAGRGSDLSGPSVDARADRPARRGRGRRRSGDAVRRPARRLRDRRASRASWPSPCPS